MENGSLPKAPKEIVLFLLLKKSFGGKTYIFSMSNFTDLCGANSNRLQIALRQWNVLEDRSLEDLELECDAFFYISLILSFYIGLI